jgi:hypothetical protein
MRYPIILLFLLLTLVLGSGLEARDEPPLLNYTTSWIGNSFGGADDKWVQNDIQDIWVADDGTVYAVSPWDEAGREVGQYRNGDVIAMAGETHGGGYLGGRAITANSRYVYFAQIVGNENGYLNDPEFWPTGDNDWVGVARRLRADITQSTPFAGGKGRPDRHQGAFLQIVDVPSPQALDVRGLAASEDRLYVCDPYHGMIQVYDAETMAFIQNWALDRCNEMALAPEGSSLWIIQDADTANAAQVVHFSVSGEKLGQVISDVAIPVDVAFDNAGQLLVGDNGIDQNIKIYAGLDTTPIRVATFGVTGGVVAAGGDMAPLHLNGITGVDVDAAGNIYISSSAYGNTDVRAFTPQGEMLWRLISNEFGDTLVFDPASDGLEVFSANSRYELDYTQSMGQEAVEAAFTFDPFRYPQDARHFFMNNTRALAVRWLEGQRFLFKTGVLAEGPFIYRFEGEVAVPSGWFSKEIWRWSEYYELSNVAPENDVFPPNRPDYTAFIWRDADGDAAFDAEEFSPGAVPGNDWGWGMYVDVRGDLWQTLEGPEWQANPDGIAIRRFPFGGLDSVGNPMYSLDTAISYPMPVGWQSLGRLIYLPETDTLYLAGSRDGEEDEEGCWGLIGKTIARFDNWSTDAQLRWQFNPQFDCESADTPRAMSIAGDYLFVAQFQTAWIWVYRLEDGQLMGTMRPDEAVGFYSGWIDVPFGIDAFQRSDGEYVILVEENGRHKNIMYRWRP